MAVNAGKLSDRLKTAASAEKSGDRSKTTASAGKFSDRLKNGRIAVNFLAGRCFHRSKDENDIKITDKICGKTCFHGRLFMLE